jgi:hypothetical protein
MWTDPYRQELPDIPGGTMQNLPKLLVLLCLLLGWEAALPGTAMAQGGPNLGRPQTGETILNRDVDVLVSADAGSRVVMSLPKGKIVAAFGTPRRTAWTQIGLGGRDIGYVPSDSLDSIFIAREVSGRAAVVSRQRWTFPNGALRGTHVLIDKAAGMEIRDGKKRETKLERGAVMSLLDLQDGKARLSSDSIASITLPPDQLAPIIGVHDYDFSGSGPARNFYAARIGDYLTPVEAEHAWTDFIAAAGQQYAPYTRFIYPMIGRSAVTFALAFGPLDRQGVNNMCVALAQRMLDC